MPLEGAATLPPAIVASAPSRPSLTVGTSTTVPIVVRNTGTGPLTFTPARDRDRPRRSLAGGPAEAPRCRRSASTPAAADGTCSRTVRSRHGTTGEFAGAMTLAGFPPQPFAALGLGGRESAPRPRRCFRAAWSPRARSGSGRRARSRAGPRCSRTRPARRSSPRSTCRTRSRYFPDGPPVSSSGNGSFTIDDSWVVFPPDAAPDRRAAGRVSRDDRSRRTGRRCRTTRRRSSAIVVRAALRA